VRRRRAGRGDGGRAGRLTVDLLEIRLQRGSGRDRIVGERDGRLLVRVAAPPVEGRANEALLRLLAKRLRVARGRVTIVRAERSRDKAGRVDGLSAADARSRLLG
jgi:uncharacterized protein (TIGR00251 family)